MSSPPLSPAGDRLATLRINRTATARPRSGWFGKLFLLALLAGSIAGGAWAWDRYGEGLLRPEVEVAQVEVRSQDLADSVLSAQGYLKSEKQAAIGAKVPGRVLKVYVREGQPVGQNDILAELEHADMDETLNAMKASLDASDASLTAMRLSLTKAKAELVEVETTMEQDEREYQRSKKLHASGIQTDTEFERFEAKFNASRSRRDSMKAAVAVAESRLTEAEANVRESHARYHEAQQQLQNMIVRAPFRGIVISKEAEEGESIMPGGMGTASGRGAVVRLADLLHLEVETDVKEDYVSRVRKGQTVSVAVDAVPSRRFGGRVQTIIPMGDRAKGTVKVKVRINDDEVAEVNDPQSETFTLFPEMAATVHFMGEGKAAAPGPVEPQMFAPPEAILSDADGTFVWRVVDERVERVSVETEPPQQGRVRIRGKLKGGDLLVIDSSAELRADLRVRIKK